MYRIAGIPKYLTAVGGARTAAMQLCGSLGHRYEDLCMIRLYRQSSGMYAFIQTYPALQDNHRCLFDYRSLRTPNFPHLSVEEMLCAVMVDSGQSRRVFSLLHHNV